MKIRGNLILVEPDGRVVAPGGFIVGFDGPSFDEDHISVPEVKSEQFSLCRPDTDYSAAGRYELKCWDSGVVALATGGATTSLSPAIPAGAVVIGSQVEVTTTVAGIDSPTGTVALTDGSTDTLKTISAFTSGTKAQGGITPAVCASLTQAAFVLSGGADNTPSAGAIRVVIWYYQFTSL